MGVGRTDCGKTSFVQRLDVINIFEKLVKGQCDICLTLDWYLNPNGPGKFQTDADNAEGQTCYFNIGNNKLINVFPSKDDKCTNCV